MKSITADSGHIHVLAAREPQRKSLQRRIAGAGYSVQACATEQALLEQATHQPVEAMVCHVQGRGDQALALLNQLRTQQSDACVILIGPDLGSDRTAALLRAGAYDYLTSPLSKGRLESALREGLEIRRSFLQVQELSEKLKEANQELARERDGLKRWNQHLVLMNELSQALAGTLEADEILRMAGQRLAAILNIDLLGLLWYHPKKIWVHAADTVDRGLVEQARQALQEASREEASEGRDEAFQGREGKLVHRLLDWPVETVEVPLTVAKEHVGLIRLQRLQGQPFDTQQRELLKAVVTSLALALRNAHMHSQAQNLAMTDGLTNLLNRRAFGNILGRKFKEAERYKTSLCLIMADIDHFKQVNDRYGHPAGDRLLKDVASLLTQATRSVDIVTRFGGEEFAILLPNTDAAMAVALANRIRDAVEGHVFVAGATKVPVTVSLGVSQMPQSGIRTPEDLVAAADALLYRAKANGRNRVEASGLCDGAALCANESRT